MARQCQGCNQYAKTVEGALCRKCVETRVYRAVSDYARDVDKHSSSKYSHFPTVFWEWLSLRAREETDGTRKPDRPLGMARENE